MGKPSKQLMDFMSTYKIDSDEIWEVKSGGAWAIKHSALERVAAEQKIKFDLPNFAEKDGLNMNVALLVTGHMGDRTEWSIGEASPSNYRITGKQPGYPYAIAEKRAKDRVILKLLNSHGTLYSEEEADDFERRPNPHVTRPADIVKEVEYNEHGEPIDNIPLGDETIERMPKSKARADFATCQNEMHGLKTPDALDKWGKTNANRIASFPTDWQEILRGLYSEHMDSLRQGKAA